MARAPYIVRKDGRYFFHKRFVSRSGSLSSLRSHIRLALRTADYRCAVDRMLRVMRIVQQYEFNDGFSGRAAVLLHEIKSFNARLDTYDPAALVERRALHMLVDRLITEARFSGHPLTTNPPDFWSHWMAFCNANTLIEASATRADRVPAAMPAHQPVPATPQVQAVVQPEAVPPRPTAAAKDGELGPQSSLSEALTEFLKQRAVADGDGRAEEDKALIVRFVIDLVGDKRLGELSKADFMQVENALPDIPHPAGVPKAHSASLFVTDDPGLQRIQFNYWRGWFGFEEEDEPHSIEGRVWLVRRKR